MANADGPKGPRRPRRPAPRHGARDSARHGARSGLASSPRAPVRDDDEAPAKADRAGRADKRAKESPATPKRGVPPVQGARTGSSGTDRTGRAAPRDSRPGTNRRTREGSRADDMRERPSARQGGKGSPRAGTTKRAPSTQSAKTGSSGAERTGRAAPRDGRPGTSPRTREEIHADAVRERPSADRGGKSPPRSPAADRRLARADRPGAKTQRRPRSDAGTLPTADHGAINRRRGTEAGSPPLAKTSRRPPSPDAGRIASPGHDITRRPPPARRKSVAPTARQTAADGSPREGERIAKLLARAGVASRRDIERMIEDGRIAIDGVPVTTPATLLTSLRGVTVDGNPVKEPSPTRLFLFHKPAGYLTAARDPAGRPTIYDRLPADLPRLMPVGRLDMTTEGLLLLTTDGALKRQLELPATGVERTYRARAFGTVSQAQLEELIDGVEIEGMRYGRIDANLERRTGRNQWIEMTLTEGKNREVRRVLEHLGLVVNRLIRTRYGPFTLGESEPGALIEVRQADLVAFRRTLKT